MIILIFLIQIFITFLLILLLFYLLGKNPKAKKDITVFLNGFKEGLKGCGIFSQRPRYPVDYYKWVVLNEDKACEDCLNRAQLPPMDIVEWIKIGLPNTPEANTACLRRQACLHDPHKSGCQCQLILIESKLPSFSS